MTLGMIEKVDKFGIPVRDKHGEKIGEW